MADPYLGEIRLIGFTFAPSGWAFCNGQILSLYQNTALFSLLGTTYGGNGQSTFALPDLRGRLPRHPSDHSHGVGVTGGQETVTLTVDQLGSHSHTLNAVPATGTSGGPGGESLAEPNAGVLYSAGTSGNTVQMAAGSITSGGGAGGAHNNLQPYFPIPFMICLSGIFPTYN